MATLIVGQEAILLPWVARRIPHVSTDRGFGPARVIGVASDPQVKELWAAVVFHDFQPERATVQLSVAASDPRWATRGTFARILAFPFLQFGVNKVWSAIPHMNERVVKFCCATGMKREATLAHHFGPGVHAVICRMLRKDYDRLYMKGSSSVGNHEATGSTPH